MNRRKLFVIGGWLLLFSIVALFIAARAAWFCWPGARQAVNNSSPLLAADSDDSIYCWPHLWACSLRSRYSRIS
jgi:hypothetical protein